MHVSIEQAQLATHINAMSGFGRHFHTRLTIFSGVAGWIAGGAHCTRVIRVRLFFEGTGIGEDLVFEDPAGRLDKGRPGSDGAHATPSVCAPVRNCSIR